MPQPAEPLAIDDEDWDLLQQEFARLAELMGAWAPPQRLAMSDWAEQNLQIPSNTAEPGRWRRNRAPYQAVIMDAISDPKVRKVTLMTAAQVGKTLILLCAILYFMANDPAPMLFSAINETEAKKFAKEKLRPNLQINPVIMRLIGDLKSKANNHTLDYIEFPDGFLGLIGMQSPADLRMRSVARLFPDEIEGYPEDVGGEGDPIFLAERRMTTFWFWKLVQASTPSRLDGRTLREFNLGSMERWHSPCPSCGHLQQLDFFEIDRESLLYSCVDCGAAHDESAWKGNPLAPRGEFVAEHPERTKHRSFHLSAVSSPWVTWQEMIEQYQTAQSSGEIGIKGFYNTLLGLPYDTPGESVDPAALKSHRIRYAAEVPKEVLVLTAAVDVQKDRLVLDVVGWGLGKQSWHIRRRIIWGNPVHDEPWQTLEQDELNRVYHHENGHYLGLGITLVDSGHLAKRVYAFCESKQARRIFPSKGMRGDRKLVTAPSMEKNMKRYKRKVPLYILGVNEGKWLVTSRLALEDPGPGYCTFSEAYSDDEFLKELTNEKAIIKQVKKAGGKPGPAATTYEWVPKYHGARNEALDNYVSCSAGIEILDPNWMRLARELAPPLPEPPPAQVTEQTGGDLPEKTAQTGVQSQPAPVSRPVYPVGRRTGYRVDRW